MISKAIEANKNSLISPRLSKNKKSKRGSLSQRVSHRDKKKSKKSSSPSKTKINSSRGFGKKFESLELNFTSSRKTSEHTPLTPTKQRESPGKAHVYYSRQASRVNSIDNTPSKKIKSTSKASILNQILNKPKREQFKMEMQTLKEIDSKIQKTRATSFTSMISNLSIQNFNFKEEIPKEKNIIFTKKVKYYISELFDALQEKKISDNFY